VTGLRERGDRVRIYYLDIDKNVVDLTLVPDNENIIELPKETVNISSMDTVVKQTDIMIHIMRYRVLGCRVQGC